MRGPCRGCAISCPSSVATAARTVSLASCACTPLQNGNIKDCTAPTAVVFTIWARSKGLPTNLSLRQSTTPAVQNIPCSPLVQRPSQQRCQCHLKTKRLQSCRQASNAQLGFMCICLSTHYKLHLVQSNRSTKVLMSAGVFRHDYCVPTVHLLKCTQGKRLTSSVADGGAVGSRAVSR